MKIDEEYLWEIIEQTLDPLMGDLLSEFIATYEGRKEQLVRKDRDYGRVFSRGEEERTEGKEVPELTPQTMAKAAASRHARRRDPTDDNYWIKLARQAELERTRLDKEKAAARALPDAEKQKILSGLTTNPFKKPLPYNRVSKR